MRLSSNERRFAIQGHTQMGGRGTWCFIHICHVRVSDNVCRPIRSIELIFRLTNNVDNMALLSLLVRGHKQIYMHYSIHKVSIH